MRAVFALALFLINPAERAAQEPKAAQPAAEAPAAHPEAPHLADLIPLATTLSARLTKLETTLKAESDPSELEQSVAVIDATLKEYSAEFHKLKAAPLSSGGQLMSLHVEITSEREVLTGVSTFLTAQVRELVNLRHEWVAEKTDWQAWQTVWLADESLGEIKATFDKADHTIGTARDLIEIAFPQHDLHIRSIDTPVGARELFPEAFSYKDKSSQHGQ